MASTFPGLGRRHGAGTGTSNLKSKASSNIVDDDDFYKNLAAEMDEESDVSEADVSKMLADIDDMDDALFGSSMKSHPGSSVAKEKLPKQSPTKTKEQEKPTSERTLELDKSLEDELFKATSPREESPTMSPRRTSKPQPKKFDFGDFDEDDPLAGLLSDDEDGGSKKPIKKKPPKVTKKADEPIQEPKPEPAKKETPLKDDLSRSEGIKVKDDLPEKNEASPAKRSRTKSIDFDDEDDDTDVLGSLGLEKKPTPESNTASSKTKEASTSRPGRARGVREAEFGDESDLLGSLGLGASPRERRRSRPEESQEAEQAKNKVNELFGTSSVAKMLDKPPAGKQRQSQLDKILKKKDNPESALKAKEKEEKEEDFSFGSYTPSSVMSRPESAPPPRRSVRFSDEDDLAGTLDRPKSRAHMSAVLDDPIERPQSAASGISSRRTGRNSRGSTTPSDDWLELAAGANSVKPEVEKPKEQKEPAKKKPSLGLNISEDSSQQTHSEPESQPKEDTRPPSVKPPKEEMPPRAPSAADYLGLSDGDIDIDSLVKPKPVGDPFSVPVKRDTTSPFPWDTSSSGAKLGKPPGSSTPQLADDFDMDSEEEEDPLKTSQMTQQIQQLQQIQQQQQQMQKQQQQQHQQKTQLARAVLDDTPQPVTQSIAPHTSTEKPRDTTSRKPPQSGARKEPQWRQELRQKQQLQDNSRAGSAASSYEQQAALQMPELSVAATAASSLPGYTSTSDKPDGHQQQHLSLSTDTAWQEQLQRSQREMDEALRKQQAQWASQQHSLQQQLQHQQQQAMQQQQLQMQEAILKAQTAAPMTTLQMPGSNPIIPGLQSYGLDSKVHQLEMEKHRLESELQTQQQVQQQQTMAMQKAHKDYIELLEESASRRESRLRQDHQEALQQYEQRLKQLQEDYSTQQDQQQQRVKQMGTEHSIQLQQLQQNHRVAMDAVQQQHEQQLQQVKLTMQREMDVINNAPTHSKSLQAVVDQVHYASKELGSLQSHVHGKQQSQLEQRSVELGEKDQQLQALEKRLSDKQDEMNEERARLEALVSRLEAHIRQQNTQLDEERFRLRQELSKLTSLQRATEEERKLAAEQLAAQHASLQQAKDALLAEQKTLMGQCLEERKALAAERAQLASSRRQLETSLQEQTNKAMQVGAEQDGKLESLAAERSQLTAQAASLQQQQQAIQQEKLQLSQRRQELDSEQRRLHQLAETLRQRSAQIQETVTEGVEAREEGQSALQAARTIEAKHATREMNIQSQLQTLRTSQRQIAKERLDLAHEQRNIERLRGSLRCQLCGGPAPLRRSNGMSSPTPTWPAGDSLRFTPQHHRSAPMLDDPQHPERERVHSRAMSQHDVDKLLSQAELGHSLRMWKVAAEKDKEFLEEESIFLETLKSPFPAGYVQRA